MNIRIVLALLLATPALLLADEPSVGTLIQMNSVEGLLKVALAFVVIDFFRRRQKKRRK